MSAIKVQGETYETAEELNAAIAELEVTLGDMPDGTPEHEKLAQHVAALRAAADESGTGEALVSPAPEVEPVPELPSDDHEPEEPEHTHSLRDAADNAKQVVCPLCGNDIPFPEAPPLDPTVERCDSCDGWGTALTGSRVDGHVWRDCPKCQGNGYTTKAGEAAPTLGNTAAPVPEAPGAIWNNEAKSWNPPPGQQPPWAGAVWDSFLGKWN